MLSSAGTNVVGGRRPSTCHRLRRAVAVEQFDTAGTHVGLAGEPGAGDPEPAERARVSASGVRRIVGDEVVVRAPRFAQELRARGRPSRPPAGSCPSSAGSVIATSPTVQNSISCCASRRRSRPRWRSVEIDVVGDDDEDRPASDVLRDVLEEHVERGASPSASIASWMRAACARCGRSSEPSGTCTMPLGVADGGVATATPARRPARRGRRAGCASWANTPAASTATSRFVLVASARAAIVRPVSTTSITACWRVAT